MKRYACVPGRFLILFGVMLIVTPLLGLGAAAMAQGPPSATPSPSDTSLIPEDERTLSPAEAEALKTKMDEVLRDAEKAQNATQDEASRILGLMEDFLGFLAVVLAIAGALSFIGFLESRKVRNEVKEDFSEVRDEARSVVRKAQETRQRTEQAEKRLTTAVELAEQGAQRIENWRASLKDAWSHIDAAFGELPRSLDVAAETEGMESEVPDLPIKVLSTLEDADAILVLCDQLKMTDEHEKMGTHFLRLARFWVLKKEYPRALARAERAVKLIPQNTRERADAHRYVAWSLANWADLLPADSPHREYTLQQALKELAKVKAELDTVDPQEGDASHYRYLYVLAWTLETQGEYERAAAVYKEAREEDRIVAVRTGRKEDWRITYNRACSLVKVEHLEEALNEVKRFLKTWPEDWQRVMKDPDLEPLRSDVSWKKRLDPLVEEAKSRIEGRN